MWEDDCYFGTLTNPTKTGNMTLILSNGDCLLLSFSQASYNLHFCVNNGIIAHTSLLFLGVILADNNNLKFEMKHFCRLQEIVIPDVSVTNDLTGTFA